MAAMRPKPIEILKIALKGLAAIAAVLVTVFLLSCIPRRVYGSFSGIELNMGEEPQPIQTVGIKIDGWLHDRLFDDPRFEGRFEIDAYPATLAGDARVYFDRDASHGVLNYVDAEREPSLGVLYTEGRFASMAIHLFDRTVVEDSEYSHASVGTPGRRVIVAPAGDVDESRAVLDRLSLSWLQNFTGLLRVPRN